MTALEFLALLARLGEPEGRREAARACAAATGAREIFALIRDVELDLLVPAPGFPQTLPGGEPWRTLMLSRAAPGRRILHLPPTSGEAPVASLVLEGVDGTVLILIDGVQEETATRLLEASLPLLGALFRAEQRAGAAAGKVAVAAEAEAEALSLAAALEHARKDLAHALGEAGRLNEKLTRSDQRKDEFLAMLAHELRNPLAPVVTALHLIRLRGEAARPFEREVQIMERQLRHLTRLVEDLLDVSRITRGKIELRPEKVQLAAIVERAVETVEEARRARGQRLTVGLPREPIWIEADPIRIAQVLANLLGNASKYTPAGGSILLRARACDAEVEIVVEDDGIGIGAETLPWVFDLFAQAPQALDRSQGGLGIGLTISRSLAELHGGSLVAESDGPGKGSRFTLRLPIGTGSAADSAPETVPESRAQSRGLRILVVEDNEDSALTLGEALRMWGHQILTASEGTRAIQVAGEWAPEVVLLDVGLPGLDGYQIARRLRAQGSAARIVALSGYGTATDKLHAQEAGMDDYLVKPVDLGTLRQMLARFAAAS